MNTVINKNPHSCGAVKVGLVGFGYWGPKLMRNFSEMPEADLDWCVDRDEARLARVRASYPGVRTSQNLAEMLDSDVEAVIIATPVRTHFQLARAALLAGKHVMVEKPLAATSAEAAELVELSDMVGVTLMVGHTFVYNPAVNVLRDMVASGEIGDIYYVDSARLNLGIFQRDINVIWDLAPHDLSILMHVLQAEPIAVSASGTASITPGVHDVAYLELRFPGDILAHVHVSWLDPCKVRRVTIVGSKKMVVCDDVATEEKVRIYDKGVNRPFETDRFTEFPMSYRYGGVSIPPIPFGEPLRLQCNHFTDCILNGTRPRTDGNAGLIVVRVLEQADRSLQNGGARQHLDVSGKRSRPPAGVLGASWTASEPPVERPSAPVCNGHTGFDRSSPSRH
jgi:predicted dehydrogenase